MIIMSKAPRDKKTLIVLGGIFGISALIWGTGYLLRSGILENIGTVMTLLSIVVLRSFDRRPREALRGGKFDTLKMRRSISRRSYIIVGLVLLFCTLLSFVGLFILGPSSQVGVYCFYSFVIFVMVLAVYAAAYWLIY